MHVPIESMRALCLNCAEFYNTNMHARATYRIHPYTGTYTHTYIHARTYWVHARAVSELRWVLQYKHTCTCYLQNPSIHTHTHTHTHTYIHIYIHARTYGVHARTLCLNCAELLSSQPFYQCLFVCADACKCMHVCVFGWSFSRQRALWPLLVYACVCAWM